MKDPMICQKSYYHSCILWNTYNLLDIAWPCKFSSLYCVFTTILSLFHFLLRDKIWRISSSWLQLTYLKPARSKFQWNIPLLKKTLAFVYTGCCLKWTDPSSKRLIELGNFSTLLKECSLVNSCDTSAFFPRTTPYIISRNSLPLELGPRDKHSITSSSEYVHLRQVILFAIFLTGYGI